LCLGDAHPLGALPIGTRIHNIERYPGVGGSYCHAAGSSAEITGSVDDRVIVKLPSDLSISLDRTCMATVGQVSHASKKDEKMSHPVERRDLGIRPRSGLWQRKDGYAGRKIHPPKKLKIIGSDDGPKLTATKVKLSYQNWHLSE
jgi:large subunit ribosomal protein L2